MSKRQHEPPSSLTEMNMLMKQITSSLPDELGNFPQVQIRLPRRTLLMQHECQDGFSYTTFSLKIGRRVRNPQEYGIERTSMELRLHSNTIGSTEPTNANLTVMVNPKKVCTDGFATTAGNSLVIFEGPKPPVLPVVLVACADSIDNISLVPPIHKVISREIANTRRQLCAQKSVLVVGNNPHDGGTERKVVVNFRLLRNQKV